MHFGVLRAMLSPLYAVSALYRDSHALTVLVRGTWKLRALSTVPARVLDTGHISKQGTYWYICVDDPQPDGARYQRRARARRFCGVGGCAAVLMFANMFVDCSHRQETGQNACAAAT